MTNHTDVITRKPYTSGHSDVITVSGVPSLSKNSEWVGKVVDVDGEDGILFVSSEDMTESELEDIEIDVTVE